MTLLYEILSLWAPDSETPRQIAARIRPTLEAFKQIDPLLARWLTSDPSDPPGEEKGIDPLRADLAPIIAADVWLDHLGRPDPEDGGYGWYCGTCEPAGPGTPRTATFEATAGSKFRNYCRFEIGSNFEPPDLAVITYPLYRAVMLAILRFWPANWACAKCSAWGPKPAEASGDPTFPYSQYEMPWIGYLCAERTKGLVAPSELIREPTAGGGLLMIAVEERLDPSNRDHMARSKLLAEILIERGGDPAY